MGDRHTGRPRRGGRVCGVVVAAGRSERFGGEVPKQFLDLAGRPVVARAVASLATRPAIDGVIVVLAAPDLSTERGSAVRGLAGVAAVVEGGATRAQSVLSGVRAAVGSEFVLVHDAARPLAGPTVVDAVVEATLRHGAAVPGLVVADTVKELGESGEVARTLERSRLRLAQTPQGARVDWLLDALERALRDGAEVADEAAALERVGRPVQVVPGDPRNLKITTSEDLEQARRLIDGDAPDLRVGCGFDLHRFAAGRRLVLGGVEFVGEVGLEGHSDADVVLHAIMDAALGAAALGDIGCHFPPGDEPWAGAASTDLAVRVRRMLGEAGFALVNVDVTILAERPRIGERVAAMRGIISRCLGLEPGQVGLKSTTLEGLGALGRAEGIGCQAVVLIRRVHRP